MTIDHHHGPWAGPWPAVLIICQWHTLFCHFWAHNTSTCHFTWHMIFVTWWPLMHLHQQTIYKPCLACTSTVFLPGLRCILCLSILLVVYTMSMFIWCFWHCCQWVQCCTTFCYTNWWQCQFLFSHNVQTWTSFINYTSYMLFQSTMMLRTQTIQWFMLDWQYGHLGP